MALKALDIVADEVLSANNFPDIEQEDDLSPNAQLDGSLLHSSS